MCRLLNSFFGYFFWSCLKCSKVESRGGILGEGKHGKNMIRMTNGKSISIRLEPMGNTLLLSWPKKRRERLLSTTIRAKDYCWLSLNKKLKRQNRHFFSLSSVLLHSEQQTSMRCALHLFISISQDYSRIIIIDVALLYDSPGNDRKRIGKWVRKLLLLAFQVQTIIKERFNVTRATNNLDYYNMNTLTKQ